MSNCNPINSNSTVPIPTPVQARTLTNQFDAGAEQALARTVAPTLDFLLEAAGLKLTPQQIAGIQQAFLERGRISIQPGGPNMETSLNVEATSLTYNSKILQAGTDP